MELFAETTIGCILALAALVTLIGMTLHDIHHVHQEARLRHARRFRKHPLVSIYITDTPSDACIESIWNSNYQRIEVVPIGRPARGKLILTLEPDIVLDQRAIARAVQTFEEDHLINAVELLPVAPTPQTVGQLFKYHRLIASGPFVSSRMGLGVTPPSTSYPVMVRPNGKKNWRTPTYAVTRWLVHTAIFIALLYASNLNLMLNQPAPLIACLLAFGLWMIIAISYYPHLTLRQRIIYLILAPVSIGYFLILSVRSVLRPLYRRFRGDSDASFWKTSHRRIIVL